MTSHQDRDDTSHEDAIRRILAEIPPWPVHDHLRDVQFIALGVMLSGLGLVLAAVIGYLLGWG